jgi:hypothetical protein
VLAGQGLHSFRPMGGVRDAGLAGEACQSIATLGDGRLPLGLDDRARSGSPRRGAARVGLEEPLAVLLQAQGAAVCGARAGPPSWRPCSQSRYRWRPSARASTTRSSAADQTLPAAQQAGQAHGTPPALPNMCSEKHLFTPAVRPGRGRDPEGGCTRTTGTLTFTEAQRHIP